MLKCHLISNDPHLISQISLNLAKIANCELIHIADQLEMNCLNKEVDFMIIDHDLLQSTTIETLSSYEEQTPYIVIGEEKVNAYQAYKLGAVDFILNPIHENEFAQSVARVKRFLELTSVNRQTNQYIIVRADHKQIKINLKHLLFIENMRNYVIFRMAEGKRVIALMSLKSLCEKLPKNFIKVHRSFVVNIEAVDSAESQRISIRDYSIPVSKSHRDFFKQVLADYSLTDPNQLLKQVS